jgi:hypothetical protein
MFVRRGDNISHQVVRVCGTLAKVRILRRRHCLRVTFTWSAEATGFIGLLEP